MAMVVISVAFLALMVLDTTESAIIRIVVDDPDQARRLLVGPDALIALAAGSPNGVGVVVAAGAIPSATVVATHGLFVGSAGARLAAFQLLISVALTQLVGPAGARPL